MRENVQHTVWWVEAEDDVKCLTMYRTTPHRKKDAIGNCKIILRLRKNLLRGNGFRHGWIQGC